MDTAPKFVADGNLAHETTRALAGTLEPAAFLFQAIDIAVTAVVDDVTSFGREFLIGIALAHLLAAALVWKLGGPYSRGGPWIVLWIGAVVAMPLVMVHLLAVPAAYASSSPCVQLCTYPTAPIALFAFYPWIGKAQVQLRAPAELAIMTLVVGEPLVIVEWLTRDQPTMTNYVSVIVSGAWNVSALIGGKAFGRLCRLAVTRVGEVRSAAFDTIIDFLHKDIQGAIAVIQRNSGDGGYVVRRLQDLYSRCDVYKQEMRTARNSDDLVEVVPMLANASKDYFDALEPLRIRRADWLITRRSIGALMEHALGNLLKNCVQHGASGAEINFVYEAGYATLSVADDGPGFDPEVIDNPDKNLHRLRVDAGYFGGDLTYVQNEGGGAHVRLTVRVDQ